MAILCEAVFEHCLSVVPENERASKYTLSFGLWDLCSEGAVMAKAMDVLNLVTLGNAYVADNLEEPLSFCYVFPPSWHGSNSWASLLVLSYDSTSLYALISGEHFIWTLK
jgi:hypothetical protein